MKNPFQYQVVNGFEVRPFTFWKGKKKGEDHYTAFFVLGIDHLGSFHDNIPHIKLCEIQNGAPTKVIDLVQDTFIDLVRKHIFEPFTPQV